jgi:hypothetical protein
MTDSSKQNVAISIEVHKKLKRYCNQHNYLVGGKLEEIIEDFLESIKKKGDNLKNESGNDHI